MRNVFSWLAPCSAAASLILYAMHVSDDIPFHLSDNGLILLAFAGVQPFVMWLMIRVVVARRRSGRPKPSAC